MPRTEPPAHEEPTGLRVLAVPAFRNRDLNPYNALLYAAMARSGVRVDELTPRRLLGVRYDILHLHWPEYLFSAAGRLRALGQAGLFMAVITWMGWRRTKIVWTVHNLGAHEPRHRRLERSMWTWFTRRLDGYITLSETGRDAAVERFPALEGLPGFVIPHGHYRGAYLDVVDRETARRTLALPLDATVLCFIGAIRAYKNVPSLVTAFRRIRLGAMRLLIAGRAEPGPLRANLEASVRDDPRIRLDLGHVAPDLVQVYLRAADLVVLPYGDVLNSGSAMLALSFDVPVLVPAVGAMTELRDLAGPEWVRTYSGELTPAMLEAAVRWATAERRSGRPALAELAWGRLARRTITAYDAMVNPARAARGQRLPAP